MFTEARMIQIGAAFTLGWCVSWLFEHWKRNRVPKNPFIRGNDKWRRERLELRRKIKAGLNERERKRGEL